MVLVTITNGDAQNAIPGFKKGATLDLSEPEADAQVTAGNGYYGTPQQRAAERAAARERRRATGGGKAPGKGTEKP